MGVFSGPKADGSGFKPNAELDRILTDGTGVDMASLRAFFGISAWTDLLPRRPGQNTNVLPVTTPDHALRNSAVWACLRLRADLLSTLPLNVFRKAKMPDGSQIDLPAPTPPVLRYPGGATCGIVEWNYSTQIDLDRVGNTIGIITARDGNALPAVIELQPTQSVSINTANHGRVITSFKIDGKTYDPADIWHEKQFTVSGLPVGLSPVGYAALTLGRWQSIEQFALGWFSGGAVPRARLQNTAKKINGPEATAVKEAWRAAIAVGEPFVYGSDWTYDLIQADQASADWLAAQNASVLDVSRFFGCPADLIDAEVQNATRITYANVTQRHLQFLITHLRPAIRRREWALSQLTLSPRFVKFDVEDFLAMDPDSRATYVKTLIDARVISPDEGREYFDRAPFTQAQIDQLMLFFPPKAASPPAAGSPNPGPAAVGPGDSQGS